MTDEYRFKLFSYLSMAIITVAIMVGLYVVFQHIQEEEKNEESIATQVSVLQNQLSIKKFLINLENASNSILENQRLLQTVIKNQEDFLVDSKKSDLRVDRFLENITIMLVEIGLGNSKKLDILLEDSNLTNPYPASRIIEKHPEFNQ